ncbi:MAG: ferritin family protein [Deltaproteobacteria bacterium]|nr:ferritin family protein [Deltaproteobacteria bacterium]
MIDELSVAHNTEIDGYFYYTAAADVVGDEKGKDVFKHLAEDELEHIKAIAAIAEAVKSGMGWISYEEALKRGTLSGEGGAPIFPKQNELIKRLRKNQTDLNAIGIGIEAEENAVEFYGGMLGRAETPVEKVVLTNILEMEKGHLKMLRWERESLIKTGFWCGTMEYSVEKEAD